MADRVPLDLLHDVSRAFYLTLRVLPRGLREPLGLAYLLARSADTIADTAALEEAVRLERLLELRQALDGAPWRLDGPIGGTAAEARLLRWLPAGLAALQGWPEPDRGHVREIVRRLSEGMEQDLRRFSAGEPGALDTFAELDHYTYLVAGCVGEFWTRVSAGHVRALAAWDLTRMSGLGVDYGKALQLVNVLRDVPADLHAGRCYLPREWLERHGLAPGDLLDPSCASRARPVLAQGIGVALERFRAAERYVLAIPRHCLRLRLAALWPILLGLATLERLARNPAWLDPERRSKVSRATVYRIVAASLLLAASNSAVAAWIGRLRRSVRAAL